MANHAAPRKAKQYTILGILNGAYDDDLDKLLRAIQKRRVNTGKVRVLSPTSFTAKPKKSAPTAINDMEVLDDDEAEVHRLVFGRTGHRAPDTFDAPEKVTKGTQAEWFLRYVARHAFHPDSSHNRAYTSRYPGTFAIERDNGNQVFYSKSNLEGQVLTVHPEHLDHAGFRFLLCTSVGRRRISGIPLDYLTRRKRTIHDACVSGKDISAPPETFLDFLTDADPMQVLVGKAPIPPTV